MGLVAREGLYFFCSLVELMVLGLVRDLDSKPFDSDSDYVHGLD